MIPFPANGSGAPAPDPEDDIAQGVIRITINGSAKVLPTLKIGPFEDQFLPKLAEAQSVFGEDRSFADLVKLGTDALIDLLVAYDATGALGGKEWLRNNADHNDLVRLATKIVQRHTEGFRKAVLEISGQMRQINQQAVAMAVVERVRERSTNGASPTGDSTPTTSDTA